VAKTALIDLVTTTLPAGTDVSLRAFGTVPDSCETRLVVPQAALDPAAMAETIAALEVVNLVRTPLGASLEAVARDLGTSPGPKIVVFVTDGEETCGGDPAAAIQTLIASGIDVRVNIVGFALDEAVLKAQFEGWAQLGNGRYIDAADGAALAAAVAEAVQPTFDVLDQSGEVIARGQVGGIAIGLPPGTYSVDIRTDPVRRFDGVIVRSAEETTVTLTNDRATAMSRWSSQADMAPAMVPRSVLRRGHHRVRSRPSTRPTLCDTLPLKSRMRPSPTVSARPAS